MTQETTTSLKMADVYRFLAQAMQYPESGWLDQNIFSVLHTFFENLGWQEEAEMIADLPQTDNYLEDLQVEYTRLFINAVPGVIAPLYGSVYLSSDGKLYGPSAVKTKEFYRSCGFDMSSEWDMPDHICLELEFLALLAEEGQEDEEERFLNECFRTWFPAFRDKVLNEVRHPFYRVLVNLIDFFTREEQ